VTGGIPSDAHLCVVCKMPGRILANLRLCGDCWERGAYHRLLRDEITILHFRNLGKGG
jgi:hypothetical protein